MGPVDAAGAGDVTFLTNDKHKAALEDSGAGAVILTKRLDGLKKPQLVVKDVNAALIEALTIFAPKMKSAPEGLDLALASALAKTRAAGCGTI